MCELRVLGAHDRGDLVAEMLGQCRRCAAGRHRHGDRLVSVDGGEDEGAQLRYIDDVAEKRPRLGVAEDAPVDRRDRCCGDDEKPTLEVGHAIPPPDDRHVTVGKLRHDLRCNHGDPRARIEQAVDLLECDAPTADDEDAPPGEIEARHVVAGGSHIRPRPM